MQPLSQDQLAAFAAVVRAGSFTAAARELHLTQPALSRRIANLETHLATALIVRGPRHLTLTDAGQRLLGFILAQRALEDELLAELAPRPGQVRGVVRLVGTSSLVPDQCRAGGRAVPPGQPGGPARSPPRRRRRARRHRGPWRRRLRAVLRRARSSVSLVRVAIGVEEYVVIERARGPARPDVFLDTSTADRATDWFFARQPAKARPRRWQRSFLDDDAGILLGVSLGLGARSCRATACRAAARSASTRGSTP
jgi:DNA-binding transcriptional LysR family regulator